MDKFCCRSGWKSNENKEARTSKRIHLLRLLNLWPRLQRELKTSLRINLRWTRPSGGCRFRTWRSLRTRKLPRAMHWASGRNLWVSVPITQVHTHIVSWRQTRLNSIWISRKLARVILKGIRMLRRHHKVAMRKNGLIQLLKIKREAKRTFQIWSLNRARSQSSQTWCKSQASTTWGHSMMFSMSDNNHQTSGRGAPKRMGRISSMRQRRPCQRRRRRRRRIRVSTLPNQCLCRIENRQMWVHQTLLQSQLLAMLKLILIKQSWIQNTHLTSNHQQLEQQGSKKPLKHHYALVWIKANKYKVKQEMHKEAHK